MWRRVWFRIANPSAEELLVAALGLLASACVATCLLFWFGSRPGHQVVVVADGQPAWLITCSSPGDCVTEAARVCQAGYQVVGHDEQRGTDGALVIRCGR